MWKHWSTESLNVLRASSVPSPVSVLFNDSKLGDHSLILGGLHALVEAGRARGLARPIEWREGEKEE